MKRSNYFILAGWCTVALLLVTIENGCAPPPKYVEKPYPLPFPIVYCNDATGHIKGNAPWILGGKCCCTPTEKMFSIYKSEGTVPRPLTYEEFLSLFEEKGINTDLNPRYRGTNNLNPFGPHVVKGGKDMGTPTPGTSNFEEVVTGKQYNTDPASVDWLNKYLDGIRKREGAIEKKKIEK